MNILSIVSVEFILILLFAGIGWGITPIVSDPLGVGLFLFLRFFTAGIFLILLGYAKGETIRLTKQTIPKLASAGFFLYSFNMIFVVQSFAIIPTGIVAAVMAMSALPNMIFAYFVLNSRIQINRVLATILMSLGIYLLCLNTVPLKDDISVYYGVFLALLGLFISGYGHTFIAKEINERKGCLFQGYAMVLGSLFLFVFSFYDNSFYNIFSFKPDLIFIMVFVFLTFISTGWLYILYFKLVEQTDNVIASYVWYYVPVIAILYNTANGNYNFGFSSAIGMALLILGGNCIHNTMFSKAIDKLIKGKLHKSL